MSYPDIVLSRQTLLTCLETIPTIILLFFSQERTGYGLGKFQSSDDVAKARGAAPWRPGRRQLATGNQLACFGLDPPGDCTSSLKGQAPKVRLISGVREEEEDESVSRSGECLEKWRVS